MQNRTVGSVATLSPQILIDAKATRQALNEIESRHDEILKLEKSIKDLHDMFQYLAMEVEAQVNTTSKYFPWLFVRMSLSHGGVTSFFFRTWELLTE